MEHAPTLILEHNTSVNLQTNFTCVSSMVVDRESCCSCDGIVDRTADINSLMVEEPTKGSVKSSM